MSRWQRGEAEVEQLLAAGELQAVTGSATDGAAWLANARRTLDTATMVADTDPTSGYVLAYDAARQACTGLLAQQGLRPTTTGGHLAVERAVRAQFSNAFQPYGMLRRRRNELEYPSHPAETVDDDETKDAIAHVQHILTTVEQLLPHLGLFGTT